jgi:hypothetical protein
MSIGTRRIILDSCLDVPSWWARCCVDFDGPVDCRLDLLPCERVVENDPPCPYIVLVPTINLSFMNHSVVDLT